MSGKNAPASAPPKPGSVRVHNDSEVWKPESPDLKAGDTDATAKLIRNHIVGGATIPEHWFGGAGDVNRATGEDMSGPTFKVMSMRQAFIGHILVEVGKYVIRQWELAHNGKEPDLSDPVYALAVHWPEMVAKDTTKYAGALQQVTAAASQAMAAGLLSRKTAIEIIEAVAGRLGVPFDAQAELAAIGDPANAAKVPETDGNAPVGMTEAVNNKVAAAPATDSAAKAAPTPNTDPSPVSAQTDLLAAAAGEPIKAWVDFIRSKVDAADSLEALRDGLLNSYPDMDSGELAKVMALAFAAADLSGRFDVANEND